MDGFSRPSHVRSPDASTFNKKFKSNLFILFIYLLIRAAITKLVLEHPPAFSREEGVAVLILLVSSTWIFVRTLEQNATALLVAGLGARAIKHDSKNEAGLQDLIDQLVKETGVVRLEVLICDIAAINFFALKTFEGRNMIFVTEGAVNRLDARLMKAGLTQSMVRLNQPEVRAWSAYCLMFASLHQIRLGFRVRKKSSNVSAIAGFRILGGFFALFGLPLRYAMDSSRVLDADEEASRITRDPVTMAELVSRLHVQWSGIGMCSPALNVAAFSDLRWTNWGGFDPQTMRTQSSEHISPVTRIQKVFVYMQVTLAPLFKVARSKRQPRRAEDDTDPYFRVMQKGKVVGPHSTTAIGQLGWMNARTVVQPEEGGSPYQAFEFASLRRLYFGRFKPCPRCGVGLTPFVHQKVEMQRCMNCHGILLNMKSLKSLGIQELSEPNQRLKKNKMARLEREANVFLNRTASEGARAFPETKCPECSKPMAYAVFPQKGAPLVLLCGACSSGWFDAEEFTALVDKLDRFISWERVLESESDVLLPKPDLVLLSKEEQARASGVNISQRKMSDFMESGPRPVEPGSTRAEGPLEEEEAKPEKKKGLIRGAFVPRNAEEVRKERTLKARRERFRQNQADKGRKGGSTRDAKKDSPKD